MSTLAHVAVATRVVVAVVASTVLFVWLVVPAGCGEHDELRYKLIALGALILACVPLALRAARRARGGAPERGTAWDVAIVVGVTAILLLMQLGPGRRVIADGCGFAPDMSATPTQ